MGCIYPYRQMVIRPDGKVSLCCNDALGKVTVGDIKTQSILEVWNSSKYREIRRRISLGRGHYQPCEKCDTVYMMWKPKVSL